jgi:hypothetical protein
MLSAILADFPIGGIYDYLKFFRLIPILRVKNSFESGL